jgi:hypothetical protein
MTRPQTWLEATQCAKESQYIVFSQHQKPSFPLCPHPTTPVAHPTPLKIQKLTQAEMVECHLKSIFYNCDENYFPSHKYTEKKFFMDMYEDVAKDEIEASHVAEIPEPTPITPPSNPLEVELVISLNALIGFYAPQTLKLIGYIKQLKVIIINDSGITHNFIHRRISHENHCYTHSINNFQIMVSNGGSMKCGGCCENVHLQIGQYNLKSHMFTIDMGGCDIMLDA